MTSLRIAEGLSLPLEAVTEKLGFLGRTGSGKTYAAQKLAEEMARAGAQFVALDPVGKWWSLRLAADGKTPALPLPVFGGLHGDVPIEPTAGNLMADVIVDRGISAVVDVSQFESDAQKARFMTDFGNRFFFRKKVAPSAVHLFIEECQEFVPQNPQRDEALMLHAWTRIQKLGRNFGIGTSLLTQRPQEVNKKVLNQTEVLFVFQLTGVHERESVAKWIEDKGLNEDIAAELPKLKQGCPHIWSPAWLQVSKVIRIAEKKTYDASSTPAVGHRADVKELAPIDLQKLRTDMAATIERAKAEDPRELRRQLAEVRAQLARSQKQQPAPAAEPKVVEVPVLGAAEISQLNAAIDQLEAARVPLAEALLSLQTEREHLVEAIAKANPSGNPRIPPGRFVRPVPRQITRDRIRSPAIRTETKENGDDRLSSSQQRILDSLAWLESVGIASASKTQVALLADQSPTSGGYFNNLGRLRSYGLIEYPAPSIVALTDSGRSTAKLSDVPTTSHELHEQLFRRLSSSQAEILRHVIRAYPRPLRKDELAERAGQSPTSGGYFNNLGRLRSLGLIAYPQPGMVVAQPVLFLDG